MDQIRDTLIVLLGGLFALVVTAITAVESAARHVLAGIGIVGEFQTALLAIILLLLIVAAFRLLGGIFGFLLACLLIVILLHAFIAGPTATTL